MITPPLKLNITLHDMPVPVYRVVLVPEDINMLQLHFVIQVAMGWANSHMFQFQDSNAWMEPANLTVGIPNPFDMDGMWEQGDHREADKVTLKSVFLEERQGAPFWYWYDFGDSWWHEVQFLEVAEDDPRQFQGIPACTGGAGACPPEDCGGEWGYKNFLAIVNDKKHPEYAEMREWAELPLVGKYNPDAFSMTSANKHLAKFYRSKAWRMDGKQYFS